MAKCFRGSPVYRQFVGTRNVGFAMRNTDATQRDVFYTGPCPSADPNDQTNMDSNLCNAVCSNICSGICGLCGNDCMPKVPVYAFYADEGTLDLYSGGLFPLADTAYSVGPVEKQDSAVTLLQSGRYLVAWTLTGTAQSNFSTTLALLQNGEARSTMSAIAMQGETVAYVGQRVIDAAAGDVISLASSSALYITGMPAATLTLLRIA